ncbi:MAG: hypothetical protein V6Z81_09135 [Parvularculales bacterium]
MKNLTMLSVAFLAAFTFGSPAHASDCSPDSFFVTNQWFCPNGPQASNGLLDGLDIITPAQAGDWLGESDCDLLGRCTVDTESQFRGLFEEMDPSIITPAQAGDFLFGRGPDYCYTEDGGHGSAQRCE